MARQDRRNHPFSRRQMCAALAAGTCTPWLALAAEPAEGEVPRVAALTTTWFHNSHADLIAGRLLEGYTLDGQGKRPRLRLASCFIDQLQPPPGQRETGQAMLQRHGVPLARTVREALEAGQQRLAVDGVLLLAEQGQYPKSPLGQTQYPKRAWFEQVLAAFDAAGRVTPVFVDKHLADTWTDAEWIYRQAGERKIPLMAGSSIPVTWRRPAADVPRDAPLREIVALSYHTLDAYGFHTLEAVQALAERRTGGETGVRQVRTLTGNAVWQAWDRGEFDVQLLQAAVARQEMPFALDEKLRQEVKEPVLWRIEYRDGLMATVLTLNYAVKQWTAAWRTADGARDSTLFFTQEYRPLAHFDGQVEGIERFIATGTAPWPVERTLLTSGVLDALLQSLQRGGEVISTPHLEIVYQSTWDWKQPPPPPPDRPLNGP